MAITNSAPQGTYSFANIQATVDGTVISGFGHGNDAVSIVRTLNKATIEYGADGTGQQNIYQPNPYNITFKILAISPVNNTFAALFNEYDAGVIRPISIHIKATGGAFSFFCYSVIANHGPITAGFDKAPYEWLFTTAQAKVVLGDFSIGGNGNLTGSVQQ